MYTAIDHALTHIEQRNGHAQADRQCDEVERLATPALVLSGLRETMPRRERIQEPYGL